MLKCANPSDYDTPVFKIATNGENPLGILIYPTEIVVYGSNESSELRQSVQLMENRMTHICVTFTKDYEGVSARNLCSIYVNGISNVNFSFSGASSFGDGNLTIGQPDTDAYLYKMRVYGSALDSFSVFNNFLNCVIDGLEFNRIEEFSKNDIVENDEVDYTKCKNAGFNIMVVTMDNPEHDIPSIDNQASYDGCSLRFEYAGAPEKNVTVGNVSIDGQGTTSKRYFRWNLRAKTNDETT